MQKATLLIFSFLIGLSVATAGNPIPFVNQPLVPDTAAPGGGPFTLTVNGGGFVSGATVRWNGTPLTTQFVSNTQLTAFVPAADVATTNTANVAVSNPGTAVPSNTVYFPVGTPSKNVYYSDAPGSPLRPSAGFLASWVTDVNNDGRADIVGGLFTGQGATSNDVFLGKGDGTFSLAPATQSPTGFDVYATGDFNGDGRTDLMAFDPTSGAATVLFGNGDGTFTPGPASSTGFVGQFSFAVFADDFNGDGNLDFLGEETTADGAPDGVVQAFFGNGDGTFAPGPKTQLPTNFDLYGIGDFNGDGTLDLALESYDAVTVMLGNGDGTFRAAPGSPVTVADAGNNLAAGDFNGDGKQDLAVPNGTGAGLPTVFILLGNGDGTFTKVPDCCGPPQQHIDGLWIAPGDFNDDGKLDLALTIQNQQNLTNPLPEYMEILLGYGDGTFTPTDWTALLPCDSDWPFAADLNGDGKLDFVTRDAPCAEVSVLLQGPLSGPAPDFTISAAEPSISVVAGGTVTDDIKIADVDGFLAPTSPITCSGLPLHATCTLEPLPGMIIPTATGSFTMTIKTQSPTAFSSAGPVPSPQDRQPPEWGVAAAALALLLVTVALTRKKPARIRALALAPLAALLLCATLWAACGASAPPQPPTNVGIGTPPGTYTLTVTETMGSTTHSTTVTLTVK